MSLKKKWALGLTILVVMLALPALACSILDGDGGGSSSAPSVRLVNDSGRTVCYVYISPVTDDMWGEDWLGSTEVVGPGDTRTFDVSSGDYDMMATDCDGNELAVEWGVTVDSRVTWTISD